MDMVRAARGAAVVVLLAGAGCARVATPAPAASPEDVVRAYVAAVNAKDCSTAKELAPGSAGQWCGHVRLDDLQVTGTSDEAHEGDPSRQVKHVSVQFTLHGGDGSMGEGRNGWGYLLDRTGPDGAWRIDDQGMV